MASKTVGIVFIVLSAISFVVALLCFIIALDLQSEYDRYCTGIVGAFARIGDGGQSCEDAYISLLLLRLACIVFGVFGLIAGIVGIIQITNDDFGNKNLIIVPNGTQNVGSQQNIKVIQPIVMSQEHFQRYVENTKPPD